METSRMPTLIVMNKLNGAFDWWDEVNNSVIWQDWIYHILCRLHGFVGAFALIQLIRGEFRVPEYGCSMQKIIQHMLFDMPSLAFFTTYMLLVLFWSEIYYQARGVSTDGLRPGFFAINAIVYATQVVLWLILWWKPIQMVLILSKIFFAVVSLFAALGFLLCGGRLFLKLQRVPVDSGGKRRKLQEVGYVTAICFGCFFIRFIMICFDTFDKGAHLNDLNHPILNFLYYLLVEIIPCCLVLFILRKLSPKLRFAQCDPIVSGFLLYGGRLFLMLQRFPVELKGWWKKLREVGYVTTICFCCFFIRFIMICFNTFDKAAHLNDLNHPILNFLYYLLVEIIPCCLILYILRKLPPKRGFAQCHPIH